MLELSGIGKGLYSCHSGRLAGVGVELSRAARARLAWMDLWGSTENVALPCHHFGIARQTFYRWSNSTAPSSVPTAPTPRSSIPSPPVPGRRKSSTASSAHGRTPSTPCALIQPWAISRRNNFCASSHLNESNEKCHPSTGRVWTSTHSCTMHHRALEFAR